MSKRRVDMDRLQELVRLHRMGTGAREVARLLGMSPNTERAYREALKQEGLLDGAADDIPALDVLRAAVNTRLPVIAPPQMVSTADFDPSVEASGWCDRAVGTCTLSRTRLRVVTTTSGCDEERGTWLIGDTYSADGFRVPSSLCDAQSRCATPREHLFGDGAILDALWVPAGAPSDQRYDLSLSLMIPTKHIGALQSLRG